MKRIPFFSSLLNLNRLAEEYAGWLFLPGMRFADKEAWWNGTLRPSPHEGIDLLFFADRAGQRRQLPPLAPVPPVWDGEVVAVFDDFLASTVVVRHPVMDKRGWRLISLYGHVRPRVGCGDQVSTNKALATVAAKTLQGGSPPPDHLHLSLAWLAPGWQAAELCWPGLWTNPGVLLIDPLTLPADAGKIQPTP